jgi:hypothetical protein
MPYKVEKVTNSRRAPARKNRRAASRHVCQLANPARVSGAGKLWRLAWVHDLSVTGIGLLLGEPVEAGAELDIEVLTPAVARTAIRGRVAHATQRDDGSWLVGCTFLEPLSPSELEKLL